MATRILLSVGIGLALLASVLYPVSAQDTEPKPEPKKETESKPDEKPAKTPENSAVKTDDGLKWVIPFERGDGFIMFSRQNDLLRVDVEILLPYYAGDGTRDPGSSIDLSLSVNGLQGRRLIFFPARIWQPSEQYPAFRAEYIYSKDEGVRRSAEKPSFAGVGDVKYADRWKATLFVSRAHTVVVGNTPRSPANEWRFALNAGNRAAMMTFPNGINAQNPAKSPEKMLSFKYDELPEREELDEDPRETTIQKEDAMIGELKSIVTNLKAQKVAKVFKLYEGIKKDNPNALLPLHGQMWLSQVCSQYKLEGVDHDFIKFTRIYRDACMGQANVHFRLIAGLASMGRYDEMRKATNVLFESKLATGSESTEFNLKARVGNVMLQNGAWDDAKTLIDQVKKLDAGDSKPLIELRDSLIKAYESTIESWNEELKFREADAKKTNPVLTLNTTKGVIKIELFEDDAPNTVASMVKLTKNKFFDGLTFHRFVQGFVIQGGDPNGNGSGGPGYRLKSEVSKRNHFRGTVGMACTGPKSNTEGSQFYICLSNNQSVRALSGKYVAIGRVIEGMDVAEKLRANDKMTTVTVGNLRDHEYEPKVIKK